jgi:hypothetical protein
MTDDVPTGFVLMKNVRIKFRTTSDGEFLTATLWLNDRPLREVSRLSWDLAPDPKGAVFQGWVKLVSDAFSAWLSSAKIDGVKDVTMFRQEADYDGETKP